MVLCLAVVGGSQALAAPDEGDAADAPPSTEPVDQVGTLEGTDLDVLQGRDAVEQLEQSGTLDEVADDVGLEPEELREELLEDSSMFLTDTGFVGYADTADWSPATPAAALSVAALPANVFDLHSRPTSSRVIYLDFDGHSAADPAWASIGYPSIVSAPFDIDGVPTTFSAAEQSLIYEVWQRVAEDYRPFDVNITTRDPGVDGIRRTSSVDAAYGQRVVITPSNFAGATVIGMALLDVFGSDADHAAYAFTDVGYKQTAKTMGEAVSHEAGHTFGLSHDGGSVSPNYYDGHGAWAPIMGRPIDPARPVTQWSRGEYSGANNYEDDLAIIANGRFSSPGAGYRPDDHADTASSPTVVPSNGVASGNIGRTGDRDVFAVDVLDGTLSVQLRPPTGQANWSNLAASVTIRNSLGNVIASAGPGVPSGWTVNLSPSVLAGRYTIEVDPIGWLTPSTGFTTYGSLGAYELAINAPQGPTPLPPGTSAFTPITPARLVDTRNGLGAVGRVAAGRQVVVQVADGVRVPADATAAVVNVAAVNPSAAGFVTVYPCSDGVPDTSTLNFVAGQTVANTTIAALSPAGQLCAWTFAETDILVDITGWLSPSGASRLTPIGPTRVVDTRSGVGGVRLAAGQTLDGRPQRRDPRRVERRGRQRHRGQRRGAGLPHRVPVQRRDSEHVHGELRRQRSTTEQHDRGVVGRSDLRLQRRSHRCARRPARLVRRRRSRVPADVTGSSARHPTFRHPRCGRRGGLQRRSRRPRRSGARCRLRERDGGQPRRARVRDDVRLRDAP